MSARSWTTLYLFPALETLYRAPSEGKGCWASFDSAVSATRVAPFGG
jgi:hypothetical protein